MNRRVVFFLSLAAIFVDGFTGESTSPNAPICPLPNMPLLLPNATQITFSSGNVLWPLLRLKISSELPLL